MSWKNRIVGHGTENPDQLLANPGNWRIHPAHQQEALIAALDAVGIVQGVIVNQRTGHLVDGHLRVTLALRREETEIPVTYVDLSEDEERLVLATLDPIAELAAADRPKLDELFDALDADARAVAQMAHLIEQGAAPKEVSFTASPKYRVIVDCDGPDEQMLLANRLRGEGYAVRTS